MATLVATAGWVLTRPDGTTPRLTSALPAGVEREPEERWSFDPGSEGYVADTAESRDTVYVLYSDGDPRVVALDKSTGEERWDERAGAGTPVHLSILGDQVVVVSNAPGGDEFSVDESEVVSLSADGDEQWSLEADGQAYQASSLGGALVVEGFEDESYTISVDPGSGEERWSEEGRLVGHRGASAALVLTDQVSVVDVDDGRQRWSEDLGDYSAAGLVGEVVVIADSEDIVGLSLADGEEQWESDPGVGEVYGFQSAGPDNLLVFGEDGFAVIGSSGQAIWDDEAYQITPLERSGEAGLLVDRSEGDGAELSVVRTSDGEEISSERARDHALFREAGDGIVTDRPIAADAVYLRGEGSVLALRLDDLEELWELEVRSEFIGGLWAMDGALALVDDRGELLYFR
ncbi:MAG: PQQ-binding-like beta-propeller repeat protein [Acidimicrobiales bacterium]